MPITARASDGGDCPRIPMGTVSHTKLLAWTSRVETTGMPMASEERLSEVLSEFARTMLTDFPIQAILDHLVGRIVDVLPVTAAGVTLITADTMPRYVAASNDSALRYE